MRFKAKPKKPTKKNTREFTTWSCTLQECIDWADENILEYGSVGIYIGEGEIRATRLETDEEFSARMVAYEKRLASWNKWYEENKAEIDAKLKEQKEKAEKRAAKKSTVAALRKEVERLQSELQELQ